MCCSKQQKFISCSHNSPGWMFKHFQNAVSTPYGGSKVPPTISLASVLIHSQSVGGKEPGVACVESFNDTGLEVTPSPSTNIIVISNANEAAQERDNRFEEHWTIFATTQLWFDKRQKYELIRLCYLFAWHHIVQHHCCIMMSYLTQLDHGPLPLSWYITRR